MPLRAEAGAGYALERGWKLPPLSLGADEASALLLDESFDRSRHPSLEERVAALLAALGRMEPDGPCLEVC